MLAVELPTLLGMVAAVLRETGIDEKSLQAVFASAMARVRSAAPDRHEALAASVIALWYKCPDYLHSDGTPLAVPEQGRALSMDALLRRIAPARNRTKVLDPLRRSSPSVTSARSAGGE